MIRIFHNSLKQQNQRFQLITCLLDYIRTIYLKYFVLIAKYCQIFVNKQTIANLKKGTRQSNYVQQRYQLSIVSLLNYGSRYFFRKSAALAIKLIRINKKMQFKQCQLCRNIWNHNKANTRYLHYNFAFFIYMLLKGASSTFKLMSITTVGIDWKNKNDHKTEHKNSDRSIIIFKHFGQKMRNRIRHI